MEVKRKLLVIGPIADFGGREIMTNMLVSTLAERYQVKVVSTISMTAKSVALKNLKEKRSWDTIDHYLYRNDLIIRLSALFSKKINRRKEPAYFFIGNKLSKSCFNFNQLYLRTIKQFIQNADFVVCSNEICGKWVKEIIGLAENANKPLLVRVTGEIKSIPKFLNSAKENLNILVHSKQNEVALKDILNIKTDLIDQTTVLEATLLKLKIKEFTPLVYGFLGRFGAEKGINELIDTFSKTDHKLLLAGSGPLFREVEVACAKNKNIVLLGELAPTEIKSFFESIDVLIIPSFEEGGPIVGVEAMAAGKLIISTEVGAMPERLSGTGNDFWFSHEIENSFQITINKVESLSREERIKIRHQVRKKYLANNALNVIKNRYGKLVHDIINNNI